MNNENKIKEFKAHLEDLECRVSDINKTIELLKEDIPELEIKDHIGCCNVHPDNGVEYLYVSGKGKIYNQIWGNHSVDLEYFDNGNCYPIYMLQNLEDAIRCKKALIADSTVIVGSQCEYGRHYYFLDFAQIQKAKYVIMFDSCTSYRKNYNWSASSKMSKFHGEWEDELILMHQLGWL